MQNRACCQVASLNLCTDVKSMMTATSRRWRYSWALESDVVVCGLWGAEDGRSPEILVLLQAGGHDLLARLLWLSDNMNA